MEWISVKDRLPEKKDEYYLFGGYTSDNKWESRSEHWATKDEHNKKLISLVGYTHWMPLPEPPKQ